MDFLLHFIFQIKTSQDKLYITQSLMIDSQGDDCNKKYLMLPTILLMWVTLMILYFIDHIMDHN